MRISDWSSDVCSSDLDQGAVAARRRGLQRTDRQHQQEGERHKLHSWHSIPGGLGNLNRSNPACQRMRRSSMRVRILPSKVRKGVGWGKVRSGSVSLRGTRIIKTKEER